MLTKYLDRVFRIYYNYHKADEIVELLDKIAMAEDQK